MKPDDQPPKRLKITYENHGEVRTVELPWDSSLPKIVYNMMQLLVAVGFSRDGIAELLDEGESSIWDWDIS